MHFIYMSITIYSYGTIFICLNSFFQPTGLDRQLCASLCTVTGHTTLIEGRQETALLLLSILWGHPHPHNWILMQTWYSLQKLIHSGLKPLRPETIRVLKKKTQVACTVIWVSQYLFRYVFSVKENKNINKVDYIKLVSTEQRKPSIKWKDNLPNGKRLFADDISKNNSYIWIQWYI